MTGGQVLNRLENEGINYRLDGDKIILSPGEKITDAIRAAILANRAQVVVAIREKLYSTHAAIEEPAPALPAWCQGAACERYELIPEVGPGCLRRLDSGAWRTEWLALRAMLGCPRRMH